MLVVGTLLRVVVSVQRLVDVIHQPVEMLGEPGEFPFSHRGERVFSRGDRTGV